MTEDPRVQELITLKTIAETMNQSNDITLMLNTVLEKLLELTGLSAGWIFLSDQTGEFECVADLHLPPGLLYADKMPMRCGPCWCLDRFWSGRLNKAVNILNCKRIENAEEYSWGDTMGITHHATVPLRSGDRQFGVLNVGFPGKEHFSNDELSLLQAVAFQIGSAIDRMRLYAAEQRRAHQFARLGEFSRALGAAAGSTAEPERLTALIVTLIKEHLDWPFAAILESTPGGSFILRAIHGNEQTAKPNTQFTLPDNHWLRKVVRDRQISAAAPDERARLADIEGFQGLLPAALTSVQAAPISLISAPSGGILIVGSELSRQRDCISSADGEVLEALAEHIAIALDGSLLELNRRELALLEERNRLARDLHDSVSQMLFSLSMTAKGVESLLTNNQQKAALSSVRDIQSLSKDAQKEMRSLIMQLRPIGLEAGLLTALQKYGERLELTVRTQAAGIRELPRHVEEGLWRIGQEALNNVHKHAGVAEVEVTLVLNSSTAVLRVSDKGRGITQKRRLAAASTSIGLSSMKERTEALGGQITITSKSRSGTTIEVFIPLPPK
ncbi:GAF domain-containing sensor histidine kinase [Paenibacillus solisilvae]|uniref:Oxygen sensor histidine kinase NreB n=1 Tax=Paenibacillus solisilvae TaxID=2486751 RepID=A0ABW0VYX6_9BACL